MSKKTPEEIEQIREQRRNGEALTSIALKFDISATYVEKLCKDIQVNIKRNYKKMLQIPPSKVHEVTPFRIEDLSPEDRERYSICEPRRNDLRITARRAAYNKANIFINNNAHMM